MDWFLKQNFLLDFREIRDQIIPFSSHLDWHDSDPSQAPGSKWCFYDSSAELVSKLEEGLGLKVYPELFLWDYKDTKILKIHRDKNDPNHFRPIVGILPLVGEFETHVYDRTDFAKPLDTCVYGPGEFLILNNTKYFHGGKVLSDTRISMHFYFDFIFNENESLFDFIAKNRKI